MNLPFFIARKYFFSRKSKNIINLISIISVVVITIVAAAMIIVLSAFNGIEKLVDGLYSTFDADLVIKSAEGKTIFRDSISLSEIEKLDHVKLVDYVIEENILVSYKDKQRIATIKSISEQQVIHMNLNAHLVDGDIILDSDSGDYCIIGWGVKLDLNARLYSSSLSPMRVYAPIRGRKLSSFKERAFNQRTIMLSGIYSINVEMDQKYILCSLDFVRDLFGYENEINQIEIRVDEVENIEPLKLELVELLGKNYTVKSRFEKNSLIYQASNNERQVIVLILSFIITIAIFNMLAALTLIIIDKAKDAKILMSFGAELKTLQQIFFYEGILITLWGAIFGIALGLILCWLQEQFGFIPLEGGIVPNYPILIKASDVLLVFAVVLAIGLIFSWFPVKYFTRKSAEQALLHGY